MELEMKFILQKFNEPEVQNMIEDIIERSNPDLPTKSLKDFNFYRKQGNSLYKKINHTDEDHKQIWKLYTQCIASAPFKTEELALAYSKRSSILMHMKKFDESIIDIKQALNITKCNILKFKILCRYVKCLVALNKKEKKKILSETKILFNEVIKLETVNKEELITLLNKTKTVYREGKIAVSKKLNKNYLDGIGLNGIEMENTDNEWCLKATHDLKPGEIICAQRLNMTTISCKEAYIFCHHCLSFSWTSVPCHACSLSVYCSDFCKKKAWELYHEIECIIFPLIPFENTVNYYSRLGLRIIIMSIRKAGGVLKLKDKLEAVGECLSNKNIEDTRKKVFSEDIEIFYSLHIDYEPEYINYLSKDCLIATSIMAKFTKIFGTHYIYGNLNNFLKNENVLFITALLLKVSLVIKKYCLAVGEMSDKHLLKSDFDKTTEKVRGICMVPINCFFKHSCSPNVSFLFTEDNKLIYYCIEPIKKSSIITISLFGFFFYKTKYERQVNHKDKFNLPCECEACLNNWPLLSSLENPVEMENKVIIKLLTKWAKIQNNCLNVDYSYNITEIQTLADDMKTLKKLNFSKPNALMCLFIGTLTALMDNLYGIQLSIPKTC